MTRLDAPAFHRWLTEQLDDLQPNAGDGRTTAAIADDFAICAALFDIDGWLRRQAGDQLHEPGHDRDPNALINHPDLRLAVEDLRTWLDQRAAATPIETRQKTYAAVAAELDRFTLQPGPFPHGDDTAGWAPPAGLNLARLPRRVAEAFRAAWERR